MKKLALFMAFAALAAAAVQSSKLNLIAALSSTPTLVSATGVNISGYNLSNPNSALVYVQMFDAASAGSVTLGTTTPVASLAIPPYGVTDSLPTSGLALQNGLVLAEIGRAHV